MKDSVPVEMITSKIYLIRGQKVMLDQDLAKLYGVETRVLKQAVKRNVSRFPHLTLCPDSARRNKNL